MDLPETFVPGFHDEATVRKMKYKNLGDTDMKVSVISLGTGSFSYFYGDYTIEECKQTVHEAIKSGINFIDTGPWYGHGEAETILGKCLEGIPRNAYYVATKVGRYEKDPKFMFDFSVKKTKQSIDETLKRLNIDYVDLLQVHDVEFAPSLDVVWNETLPAVDEIVRSGKARFVGITGYPVSTLVECIEKSKIKIDTILSYCRQTLVDDTLTQFLPQLQANHIGIINGAAHCMGLLTNYGPQDWHPAPQELKDICTKARNYCKEKEVELGKLSVYHSLLQEGTTTVLIGMNTRKLLECNLDVLYNGLSPKEEAVYQKVMNILKKTPIKHWEGVELEKFHKGSFTFAN